MSKSKNNFFTVRDIREHYTGDVIRFYLLSGHYRGPINFSDTLMESAKAGYDRIANAKENLEFLSKNGADEPMVNEAELIADFDTYRQLAELCDVLGIFQDGNGEDELGADIEALIEERQQARKEKNWARADEIRDQLAAQGITLKDTPQGVQVIRN